MAFTFRVFYLFFKCLLLSVLWGRFVGFSLLAANSVDVILFTVLSCSLFFLKYFLFFYVLKERVCRSLVLGFL